MQVELIHITPDLANHLGLCAAECYDAKTDRASNERRAASCIDRGHLSVARFGIAVFRVSGISRACLDQFVRSRFLDFLVQSQRYVDQAASGFTMPDGLPDWLRDSVEQHYRHSVELYQQIRAAGIRKEDARFVMPMATHTSLTVVGNMQAWQDFIQLRTSPAAQWEIRRVAERVKVLLSEQTGGIIG